MERRSRVCQDGVVSADQQRLPRRTDALSRARIVQAVIAMLDAGGAEALTFRALAARLSTGAGAIYHHVRNKDELLAAAAEDVVVSVLDGDDRGEAGASDVRAVMVAAFDAISTHPWLGTQLASAPWQPAVLQLFDRVGTGLDGLGVPESSQFDAASVLLHQVLGVASQYDAGSRLDPAAMDRPAFLEAARAKLIDEDDSVRHPFLARIAEQLADHDDREQFLAGVDITLAGIQRQSV
jgi:AcrR family transcriptional regulator